MTKKVVPFLVFYLFTMVLAGCGGGGGGGSSSIPSKSEFEAIVIEPQGGDYKLDNGIELSIPQGAVSEPTTFQFRVVQEDEFSMPTEYFRQYDKHFLAGVEAKPYGFKFNTPISIRIPSAGLADSTAIPYPLSLNTATNTLNPIAGVYLNMIEAQASLSTVTGVETDDTFGIDLSTIRVNEDGSLEIPGLSGLPDDQQAIVLMEIEKILAESDCVLNPCRCGRIKVESDDFESGGSAGDACYSAYSDGFVQYLDCPGQPIEPWSLHESNLDVTVTPNAESIKVGEIVYFSISVTDEKSQPVTSFSIQQANIEDSSVISQWSIGADSVGIKGLAPGISSVEVIVEDGGCQYKGFFSVEVEPSAVVVTTNTINIPEGSARMVGVKLSDPPPVTEDIFVTALVGGDNSISVASGIPMTFDNSNWDTYQYFLIAAAQDADTSNGVATITVIANPDYYVAENITVREIDDDKVNIKTNTEDFIINTDTVFIPEGGSSSFQVRLNKEPASTVNVSVARDSGDSDISVSSGSVLSFNASNWNIYQSVVLSASKDDDRVNGTAQIKISANTSDIDDRLVTAVEVELEIGNANLAIEGSELTQDNNKAYWYGVVPVTITTDPNLLCAANIQGAGSLSFSSSYSYLSATTEGGVMLCSFQEFGSVDVNVDGNQDCSNPPIYTVTAHLSKNTTARTFCADGSTFSRDYIGSWKSYAVSLESKNKNTETFSDGQDYYRVQLIR